MTSTLNLKEGPLEQRLTLERVNVPHDYDRIKITVAQKSSEGIKELSYVGPTIKTAFKPVKHHR